VGIDHLVIGVAQLPRALAHYSALCGAEPAWTGRVGGTAAAVFLTANLALVLREGLTELGLAQLCFRVDDLPRIRRRLGQVGLALNAAPTPDALAALYSGSATVVSVEPTTARGLALSFVARGGDLPAGDPVPNLVGLDHLVLSSVAAEQTAFLLAAQLGLDMRLDMRRPQWNARMMFFRCGDLILEVIQKLDVSQESAGDRQAAQGDHFQGLSWRVGHAESVHARLVAAGFDVSDVRDGRKPGTRVFTVRDRTEGVATLLLQSAPRRPQA
jgi:catechol 2,3-dioxygenase-like lactoylglutathione lyase family enzyme